MHTPSTLTSTGKSLLHPPLLFDGKKLDFKKWQHSLFTWIRDPHNRIADEQEEIDVTLSYICGEHVMQWLQNYHNTYFDKQLEIWNRSWPEFKGDLNKAFLDSNRTRMAQEKLEMVWQGQDTAEDFFQKFELLFGEAGYECNSAYVIRLLEKAVNDCIIDQIYGSHTTPIDKYADYKEAITSIDDMWRCWNLNKQGSMSMHSGWNRGSHTDRPATTPVILDQKDATGTTYGGTGKPMDLDIARQQWLCFRCGKPRHIANACPTHRGQQVW